MIDTPQRPDEAFRWRKEIQKYGEISYLIAGDTIPLNDNLAEPEGQLPIPACGRAMAPFESRSYLEMRRVMNSFMLLAFSNSPIS